MITECQYASLNMPATLLSGDERNPSEAPVYRFGEPRSSGCMRRRELLWRDQGGVYRAMHMRGRRGARDAHDGARDAHDGARDGRAGGVRCLVLPLLGALLDESPAELHHHARATTLEAAVLPLIATNCH
jgi:hypothetical protein